jgi:enoyl-CoA hydratase/carnithine racemase
VAATLTAHVSLLHLLLLLLLQMAPELLLTGKLSKAADVYSMGMLSEYLPVPVSAAVQSALCLAVELP